METLLSQWRNEQLEIAARTILIADDQAEKTFCPNTREFSSFLQNIEDKLIGGVDVSFGDGNSAIAVYVITCNNEVIFKDALIFEITQPYISSYLGKFSVIFACVVTLQNNET